MFNMSAGVGPLYSVEQRSWLVASNNSETALRDHVGSQSHLAFLARLFSIPPDSIRILVATSARLLKLCFMPCQHQDVD